MRGSFKTDHIGNQNEDIISTSLDFVDDHKEDEDKDEEDNLYL